MTLRHVTTAVVLAGLAVGSVACGSDGADDTTTLTVFAAASLNSTFTDLGARFEEQNPGTTVVFSFAGSSDLVSQLTQGAHADVFASADTATMTKAVDADLVSGAPVDFASNTLTIVVAPGNPHGIESFADLAADDHTLAICAPQVPCGAATERVEQQTGVTLHPDTEESSVTGVLGMVTSGQADAGLVYVTDASGAGDAVTTIAFPEAAGVVNTYPIAALEESADDDLARRFVEFVTGPEGARVLGDAGFGRP